MKKRIFFYIVSALILFLLQSSLLSHFRIADVVPNLLVIFTASIAIIEGSLDGCLAGFICALLLDVTYGPVTGMYALGFLIIGYAAGKTNRIFYREDITYPILIIGASDIAYGIYMYLFGFLIRGRLDFLFYLGRIILPETVYTVILAVFLYRLILLIAVRLDKEKN